MLDKISHLAAKQPKNLELRELAIQSKIMLEKSVWDSAEFAAVARCAFKVYLLRFCWYKNKKAAYRRLFCLTFFQLTRR
jgi:hypothetical protein